jgi:uncharacterized alpha-E superfamily protein
MASLEELTVAVDRAWERLKQHPTEGNIVAYDRAYHEWRQLGAGRGVGRPPSGDQVLSSTERAREARARQQLSAERWEKVAPSIQQLRRALQSGDTAAVENIAHALVKETEMILHHVQVIHAQPDSDYVVLNALHGKQTVLAFIEVIHLDDHFRRRHMSGREANLVVDRNIEAFAGIMSSKYERGEYRPYSRFGSTLPRVDITLDDIEVSGEKLTDSVLSLKAQWVSPNGKAPTA